MGFLSLLWSLARPWQSSILVVEDSPEILDLVQEVLSANGYRVTTAVDGVKGLACYRKGKFDLVILDYNMPRMTGTELLEQIRTTPQGRKQRVIMLSAEQMLDPIYKAYDKGIIEWIPKPFEAGVLLAKVAAHLQKK